MNPATRRAIGPTRTRLALLATLSTASLLSFGAIAVDAAPRPDVFTFVAHGTLHVDGSAGADDIVLRIRPNEAGILQVLASGRQVGNIDRSRFSSIVVDANDGDDAILVDESFGVFTTTVPTTIDGGDGDDTLSGDVGPVRLVGGAGDDTLLGGDAVDTLSGGDGADTIDGNKGGDLAVGGAGDDTVVWDPGDGSDAFDGQADTDTLLFNGAAGNEKVELSNNAGRLRFVRDVATITMDIGTTEHVRFNAEGGIDRVTVDNLTGTDVTDVAVDLSGTPGTGVADDAADNVIVRGTDGVDRITVSGQGGTATVSGLHARVDIRGAGAAKDRLDIDTGDGVDQIVVSGLDAGAIPTFVDGQAV
jgi:hypothetical protein